MRGPRVTCVEEDEDGGRRRRWWLWLGVAALALAAGRGTAVVARGLALRRLGGGAGGPLGRAGAGRGLDRRARGDPHLPRVQRPHLRLAPGRDPPARQRRDRGGRLRARRRGRRGRSALPARRAPVRGGARPGRGRARVGRGEPRLRRGAGGALLPAGRRGLRHQRALRPGAHPPGGAPGPARRDRGRGFARPASTGSTPRSARPSRGAPVSAGSTRASSRARAASR